MQAVWSIGLVLPVTAAGVAAVTSRSRGRVGVAAGAGTAAITSGVPWFVLRAALGDAAPTFELAFLQCAVAPIAIFAGAVVGMIVHWRGLKRSTAAEDPAADRPRPES